MRILILCKRQYTGRDLLDDKYGRMFEIPAALSVLGHSVHGIAYSYQRRPEFWSAEPGNGSVPTWDSVNGYPFTLFKGHKYLRYLGKILREFSPNIVWASSDAWHAFAAGYACRRAKIPYIVDLYDNYESFGFSKIPGVRWMLRDSCRQAVGITVVTHTLADFVRSRYSVEGVPVRVLGNAVNTDVFFPRSRNDARQALGLPKEALLVGTAGALYGNRDIRTLFEAISLLRQRWPTLKLVVAGPRDRTVSHYAGEHVIDLGVLPPDDIPNVFSALDVGVICNRDSDFGRYCYPQKYQEMLACHLPVVAARVGEMAALLRECPERLYIPASSDSLAESINSVLSQPYVLQPPVTWERRAIELSNFLENFCS